MHGSHPERPAVGLLFDYDWDRQAHERLSAQHRFSRAGFDLFSFPSNARLIGFDLARFAQQQARRARAERWQGVLSHHEQFGALAAALTAEAVGLPGPSPTAIVSIQHKLHARRLLQSVAPEACPAFAGLDAVYGGPIPQGLSYPTFVKPVKAAFSVLARRVDTAEQLWAHTRFGRRELWVIRRLVEPFERIAQARVPGIGTAHRLMLEEPVAGAQYNLDGYVCGGQLQVLGFVDAIMYPGTQAFMRFELPSRLPLAAQARAVDVARRFLAAAGFDNAFFNMEFLYDDTSGRLTVIEFNPRLASQFGDLYQRVQGRDAHAMALALAIGQDPQALPAGDARDGAAASLVYRAFHADEVRPPPTAAQVSALRRRFPDALLFVMPKAGHSLDRDFKWLGSHRYGILHLGGRDASDLQARAVQASELLGWPVPYRQARAEPWHSAAGWAALPVPVSAVGDAACP